MFKAFTCRHCGGRGTTTTSDPYDIQPCYVCHGKGRIEFDPKELVEYFRKFRNKPEAK